MYHIQNTAILIQKLSLTGLYLGVVLHEQLGKELRRIAVTGELDSRTRPRDATGTQTEGREACLLPNLLTQKLVKGMQPLRLILGVLQLHSIKERIGAAMPATHARVIEIIEDTEIGPMLFQRLEQLWHHIVSPRLLREKPAWMHPIIGRHTNKPLGLRSLCLRTLQRFKSRQRQANTTQPPQKMPSIRHSHTGKHNQCLPYRNSLRHFRSN